MFRGKSVAIVGPAAYMSGIKRGRDIDAEDIVVKINDSIPYGSNIDYGSRSDCLIVGKEFCESCTSDDIRYAVKRGCRLIISKMHSNCGLSYKLGKLCKGIVDVEFSSHPIRKMMFSIGGGKMPNSGVFSIQYVLKSSPFSVKVFGFDLYTSSVVDGSIVSSAPNCNSSSHNLLPQAKFIRDTHRSGSIQLDKQLISAVSEVYSDNLSEYLSGKRVAIVGPSRYLQGMKMGSLFDSFDVVVRVNCSCDIVDVDSFGSRTDVLYMANFMVSGFDDALMRRLKSIGVKHIVTKFSEGTRSHNRIKNRINGSMNITSMGKSLYYQYRKLCNNTPPNTGVCAIMHLLSMPFLTLDIFGFDFYMSGYLDGYQNKSEEELLNPVNWGQHNPYWQVVALQKLLRGREYVSVHDHMIEVFSKIIEMGDQNGKNSSLHTV